MIAPRRRSAFADRLLEFPDFVFSDGREFTRRGAWRSHFEQRVKDFDGRLILEIGCNDAGLLATVAAKHPRAAFVGIDWKCRALHSAATRVAESSLRNVAFLLGRGQDLCRMFAEREVDEIWIFHPDPCDKPRERANRLFAKPFLDDAAAVLRGPGATLSLKTDHREYYDAAIAIAEASSRFEISAKSENFWFDFKASELANDRLFAEEVTAFERRFLRRKQPIHYLELRVR